MRPDDLDEVLAIERVSFPSSWSRESYLRELRNPVSSYVVALAGDDIVGYAGLWIIADEAHISTFAVHPARRRRGLGRRMLSHILDLATVRGAELITLEARESNLAAQALYRQFGFRPSGILQNYYGDTGDNAIVMRRTLTVVDSGDRA